jgi:6-pyruvoyltetrahydropterin/6-carboxytetrahydropterin synthase
MNPDYLKGFTGLAAPERQPSSVVKMTVWKRFRFEAAHWLPHVPEGHKCKRVHGHSYEIHIGVKGPLHPKLGWVIDYAEITAAFAEWIYVLDHNTLNNVTDLDNSTAENLAFFVANKVKDKLPGLACVRVHETPDAWVEYCL